MFASGMLEFSSHSCSRLILHEGLVKKLHENKGQNDEDIKDARKHDPHGKKSPCVCLKDNVAISQSRHCSQDPVKGFDPSDRALSFRLYTSGYLRAHEVAVYVHVNAHEEKENQREAEKPCCVSAFFPLLENGRGGLNDCFHLSLDY